MTIIVKNGWIDDGKPIANPSSNRCPKCSSRKYTESISREKCNDCGYLVDYWGGNTNEIATRHIESVAARKALEDQERIKKEIEEENYF